MALEISTKGHKIPVSVTPDGQFTAEFNGEEFYEDTLAKLKSKIIARVSRKKIAIPVCRLHASRWDSEGAAIIENGVYVGMHGGNNNMLISWEKRPVEQFHSYRSSSRLLRHLTKEERAELIALQEAKKQSADALDKALEGFAFQPPEEQE